MLDCSGVSTAEPEPSVQTPVPSVQHTAGGNTANALYSATEETDLQDSRENKSSVKLEQKKTLPEQFSCQRPWAKLMTNNGDG